MSFFRARFLRAFEKIARVCMGFLTHFFREFRAQVPLNCTVIPATD